MRPASDQPRRQMHQLRKFNLQLTLKRRGTLGKDIEDQAGSIQHTTSQALFEVTLLAGAETLIEDDEIDPQLSNQRSNLIKLAAANVILGIWASTRRRHQAQHIRTRRRG